MRWEILLIIIAAAAALLIFLAVTDAVVMTRPGRYAAKEKPPENFMIKKPVQRMYQRGPECAGYAGAYVLKSLGREADGPALYKAMRPLFGTVARSPKEILKVFERQGIPARYFRGNLSDLEAAVSRGVPVIALILTRPGRKWLHYVPVVGYDRENLYLADSMAEAANSDSPYYNRKINRADFCRLWDTRQFLLPFVRNTFIVAEPGEKK